MKVAKVYIEYENMAVDKSFLYLCNNINAQPGRRVLVHFAHQEVIGFIVDIIEMNDKEIDDLPYELKEIKTLIDEQSFINDELFSLANHMAEKYVAPLISCLSCMLPSKLKPRSNQQHIKKEVWVSFQNDVLLKGKKQKEALAFIKEKKTIRRKDFNINYTGQLKVLVESGAVCLVEKEAEANNHLIYEDEEIIMNDMQKQALHKLMEKSNHEVYLLHGVTGSGKTEVFLQMASQVISMGKQVLILVPEISLTPQMVKKVIARFHDQVAIYHSSLNNQEKYEQYKLIYEKKVNIVVGTRSAVFMPFDNLGLIVMDEEHDQSYKQDSTPKYHTRDIAIWRGAYHHCKVVLASATPSLESYSRAIKKVYKLVEMQNRVVGTFPNVQLVNMEKAMRNGENYILSNALYSAISDRLEKSEQIILLLNRRGYAPVLRCLDCGEVVMCPHCDLALNYHKNNNQLVCHVCGHSEPKQRYCRKCGSQNISYVGMGTQRLEEYIQNCFPESRIIRMDADTTKEKNAHEKLLKKFEQSGDILLGTQMIAKGLDYEKVTLVGILNGDALLSRSDYRCVELTFDLLVQASGRSGRGKKNGDVLIQVYNEDHYAIKSACNHDYHSFFYQEMKFRHLGQYPPYTFLGSIIFLNLSEKIVLEEAEKVKNELSEFDFKVLGVVSLLKKNDLYRTRIIIKSKNEELLSIALKKVYQNHFTYKRKSKLEIDINPLVLD